jgi:hypothetical protein
MTKKLAVGLLATGESRVVAVLAISSRGAAVTSATTATGDVYVQYPYVDIDGTNCAYGSTTCKICPVTATNYPTGVSRGVLCVDYIEATGTAKLTWSASDYEETAGIFPTSGTIYPGEKILFTFLQTEGPFGTWPSGANPCPAVKITGPNNPVWISYFGEYRTGQIPLSRRVVRSNRFVLGIPVGRDVGPK